MGGVLLAVGGGGWLATRRTWPLPMAGSLQVLSAEEAAVVLAIADRLIPPRTGFPRPVEVAVPRKVDEWLALAHPAQQRDLGRLLHLFENALPGMLFEGQSQTFTESSPAEQDARLASWARSRLALRRTGYQALKRLVYSAYYAAPETHAAIGYRGPPPIPPAAPEALPARPHRQVLAPRPLEVSPAPRQGLDLPEDLP